MTLADTNSIIPVGVAQTAAPEETKDSQQTLITINPEIIKFLHKEDLSVDQLFVLKALYDGHISLLNQYDRNNDDKRILVFVYQPMFMHGFLENGTENTIYQISDKGRKFVEQILTYSEESHEDAKTSIKLLRELSQSYLELFPDKTKLPSGVYARVNINEVEKKMKAFKANYKKLFKEYYNITFTDQDILDATRAYIARYAKTKYMYMMNSSYFIQKKEKSALADEILAMKQGINKTVNKFEKQI